MVVAEGGGLIILEALDHALKRGARIYAEISGFGAAASTYSWSKPDPQGRGIALALRNALRDAQTSADRIDLVAPMGTGAIEHDAGEIAAWNEVFGDRLADVHAVSTRGAIGNNGAGSGAIDLAACVMAIHQNTVPPSVNTDALDSDCRFRFVQDDPIDAKVNCAVSSGYAMAGGQCAALVIQRYGES
jgi:3-oxoacyl-[acyl-carrier-protein] synthase II